MAHGGGAADDHAPTLRPPLSVFNNFVSPDDFAALGRQLRRRPAWVLTRFTSSPTARVTDTWSGAGAAPTHWFDLPRVIDRMNRLVSGDPAVPHTRYVADTYLGRDLRGVSLGCGDGRKERAWFETGRFAAIAGYDVSPGQIEAARRSPVPGLSFDVASANDVQLDAESVDVVIFEDSLHHLAPVREILERVRRWLVPGGILVINEYVGPRRQQWRRRQIVAADGILAALPRELRQEYTTGGVKRRAYQPSLLRMLLKDPSEAVQSDVIVPLVRELFDVVDDKPRGGTVVNLVLDEIAHNFIDQPHRLEPIFALEDALLDAGEIESDHRLMVARKST